MNKLKQFIKCFHEKWHIIIKNVKKNSKGSNLARKNVLCSFLYYNQIQKLYYSLYQSINSTESKLRENKESFGTHSAVQIIPEKKIKLRIYLYNKDIG